MFEVTITGTCSDVNDVPSLVAAVTGTDYAGLYEHRSYFLPTNWRRLDAFVHGSVGVGQYGGTFSWLIDCQMQVRVGLELSQSFSGIGTVFVLQGHGEMREHC